MKYERYPDELAHYGTKGMKWGRRKARYIAGKAKRGTKRTVKHLSSKEGNKISKSANDIKTSSGNIAKVLSNRKANKIVKADQIDKMSDEELRRRVNRMNLENQYSRLTSERTSTGMDHVAQVMSVGADAIAISVGAATIAASVHKLIKNKK